MSLLDKASLVVTPNAYKESKLYSVIPSDGSGDMTVVRATTATRINSAGLVEEVPRNILTYSEQFDNADWNKISATITANTTVAPNGTTTADTLVITSLGYLVRPITSYSAVTGQKVTASIFTKNQITDFLQFGGATPAGTDVYSIETISNGWYRHKVTRTFTTTAVGTLQFIIYDRVGTHFIWGAQLENFASATEYFPTTTRLNIPRIDYTNGSCPSLLVEPQRTNLALYSEQFDNAFWVKNSNGTGINPVVTANNTASPSGINTADKIVFNSGAGTTASDFSLISTSGIVTLNATQYTLSFYAKGNVGGEKLMFRSVGSANFTKVTLTTSWQRFTITETSIGTSSGIDFGIRRGLAEPMDSSATVFIWGMQLEAGAYATSYIPTVASSVTRNADVISKSGISSLIGQTEGTAFIECTADTTNPNGAMLLYLGSSDGSGAFNYSTYLKFSSTSLNLAVYSGGTSYVDSTSSQTYTNKQNIKVAISYKNNDFVCYANGVQLFTDTTGVVSTNLSTLSLGYYPPNIPYNQYNGNIKSVQLYKTRLTNTELAQLTTL